MRADGDDLSAGALFSEYRSTRRRETRNRIVVEYADLARRCALRFSGRGQPDADLYQVAQIGLIKAVERFDPQRGVKFETFATPTIVGELRRHFRDATWAVAVPRGLKDLRTRVATATESLRHELGRAPTPGEVAHAIGVDTDTVLAALTANRSYTTDSIDRPGAARDAAVDRLAESTGDSTDDRMLAWSAMRVLDERSRSIVFWRFWEGCTQSEIGERTGVGQVHVSRLLRRALADLHARLCAERDHPPDTDAAALTRRDEVARLEADLA